MLATIEAPGSRPTGVADNGPYVKYGAHCHANVNVLTASVTEPHALDTLVEFVTRRDTPGARHRREQRLLYVVRD